MAVQQVTQDLFRDVVPSKPLGSFLRVSVVPPALRAGRNNVLARNHKLTLVKRAAAAGHHLVLPQFREAKDIDVSFLNLWL